jgi:hypothetical protein
MSSSLQRWFPTHQPQTLQIAAALLYWNAILGLIFGGEVGGLGLLSLLFIPADVAGALGIANERKWGYVLAVVVSVLPLVLLVALMVVKHELAISVINLLFQIALVAALLHSQSRSYVRTWYR